MGVVDDNNSNGNQPTPQKQGIKKMTNEKIRDARNSYATQIVNEMNCDNGLVYDLREAAKQIANLCDNLTYYTAIDNNMPSFAVSTAYHLRSILSTLSRKVENARVLVASNATAFDALYGVDD